MGLEVVGQRQPAMQIVPDTDTNTALPLGDGRAHVAAMPFQSVIDLRDAVDLVPHPRPEQLPAEQVPKGQAEGHGWRSVRVSVVIPALNEAKNLPHVMTRLPAGLHQVILVDGFSSDRTIEVARSLRPDLVVVRQNRRGKGNALAHGFAAVTGDVIVMLDADGSADPQEIPDFVTALVQGADFAKGSRFTPGGGSADITRLRRLGNMGLNGLVNLLYRTRYTDLCYGYNAFWARLLPDIGIDWLTEPCDERVWGDGFEIETLINVRIAQAGVRIHEVASFEHPRLHGVSNLNTWRDGSRVLRTIVRERRRAPKQRRPARSPAASNT
jgi:glycosyltransferase involved in cell wall biosynthesis